MPEYSYYCDQCDKKFEIVCSIRNYEEKAKCCYCQSNNTYRLYREDLLSLNTSVKKSDNELKTIGDIANRNRDKLSSDHKEALNAKHNKYKEDKPTKDLPSGMTRMKKQPKIKWT